MVNQEYLDQVAQLVLMVLQVMMEPIENQVLVDQVVAQVQMVPLD